MNPQTRGILKNRKRKEFYSNKQTRGSFRAKQGGNAVGFRESDAKGF